MALTSVFCIFPSMCMNCVFTIYMHGSICCDHFSFLHKCRLYVLLVPVFLHAHACNVVCVFIHSFGDWFVPLNFSLFSSPPTTTPFWFCFFFFYFILCAQCMCMSCIITCVCCSLQTSYMQAFPQTLVCIWSNHFGVIYSALSFSCREMLVVDYIVVLWCACLCFVLMHFFFF